MASGTTATDRRYLTIEQTSEYLHVSQTTLNRWRAQGYGPAWSKVGARVLYGIDDIDEFVRSCRHVPRKTRI